MSQRTIDAAFLAGALLAVGGVALLSIAWAMILGGAGIAAASIWATYVRATDTEAGGDD